MERRDYLRDPAGTGDRVNSTLAESLADGREVAVSISQDAELIRGREQYVPETWRWTDPAGHTHDASLDTAHWVVTGTYWCEDCRDEHDESELRCKQCGAVVRPPWQWRYTEHILRGLVDGRATVKTYRGAGTFETKTYLLTSEQIDGFRGVVTAEWVDAVENTNRMIDVSFESRLA